MNRSPRKSIDVLVISDNEVDQMLVGAYLEPQASIRIVSSYEQAEQACCEKLPEVTICEAEMPGVDVRKICAELIQKPCVFISSRDRDIERRSSMLKVKGCYLTRPYNQEQLLRAVDTARDESVTIG